MTKERKQEIIATYKALRNTKVTYNTEAHLSEWAAQMVYIFGDYKVLHVPQSEEEKARGISKTVVVHT